MGSMKLSSIKKQERKLLSQLQEVRSAKLAKLRERPQRIAVVGFGRFGQVRGWEEGIGRALYIYMNVVMSLLPLQCVPLCV